MRNFTALVFVLFMSTAVGASQDTSHWADEFDELTYARPDSKPHCSVEFPTGQVEFFQADNRTKGNLYWVLRISGENIKSGLRTGQRLYAAGQDARPYVTLVVQADDRHATILMPESILPYLWHEGDGILNLFQTPDDMLRLGYKMISFSGDREDDTRNKLTKLFNCKQLNDQSE